MEHSNPRNSQSKTRSRSKSVNRSEFLDKADELVNGQRALDYGDALENHQKIANFWSNYLSMRHVNHLEPRDVVVMMMLIKIARLTHNSTEDSWVDLCGYAALGGEFLHSPEIAGEADEAAMMQALVRSEAHKDG